MSPGRWIGFVLVWVSLVVMTADGLRQARAGRTGQGRRKLKERRHTGKVAEYDFAGIKALHDAIVEEDAAIARFFETSAIQPMHVVYERFVTDYEATTRAMLAHIGVEPPPELVIGQPRTVRLADDTTEEWIARYRADEGG